MLYWCGIREGELLALTPADFDFKRSTLTINKSYQRLKGRDVITGPKTPKSNRTIKIPQFLADEIQDYLRSLYGVEMADRLFPITKNYLHREMDRGAAAAGVKRNWKEALSNNVGLLLFGDVGTGKSFFAGCIANALLDQDVPVLMTSFPTILNRLTGVYPEERVNFINSLNDYDLLIIDDLGVERSTEFAIPSCIPWGQRRPERPAFRRRLCRSLRPNAPARRPS